MSRPFPDTFDDARSALTPLSGGPSSSISYQANVNRRKTKKWADAKPVSYGGDDWGDEYEDDYEAAPPQLPAPRATGFRQPGQEAGGFAPPQDMPNYADGKKSYGDLPSLPTGNYDRSATLPSQMHRKNSFDNDERRAFSTGPSHIPQDTYTQHRGQPSLHISSPSQAGRRKAVAPPAETPTPPVNAPGAFPATPYSASSTSNGRSYTGEQAQQPYQQPQATPLSPVEARALSPQAAAPLYGRGVSPGSSGGRSGSPSAFPPRKASPGQVQDLADLRQGSRDASQGRVARPSLGETSPGGSAAPAQAPAAKALPFIRPADIYKRFEESTRERQSTESGRPSMDSLMGRGNREISPSGQPVGLAQHGHSAQPMDRGRSGSSSQDYSDPGHRLGTSLGPVPEREGKYSFMDTSIVSLEAAQQLRELRELEREESSYKQQYQPFRRPSLPQPAGPSPNFVAPPQAAPEAPQKDDSFQEEGDWFDSAADYKRFSVGPKLPDLNRFSGFGLDSWTDLSETTSADPVTAPAPPAVSLETQKSIENPLRRKESGGFTSVVHQAFDREDSFSDDRTGEIRRTGSESTETSDISPIISRGTVATFSAVHDNTTPAIIEESDSEDNLTKPKRPATPEQQTPFHLGHRRDLSAPSAGNSPARTPVIARSEESYKEEEAQITQETDSSLDTATPADSRPVADRMESFSRPHIPGGWQSYATTATIDPPVEEAVPRLNESPQPAEIPLPTPHEDHSDFANTTDIAQNTSEIIAGDVEAAPRLNALPQAESQVPTPHRDRSGFVDTADIAPNTANIMASTCLPDEFSADIAAKTDELAPPSPKSEDAGVVEARSADRHSPYIAKQMDSLTMPSIGLGEKGTAPDEFDPSLARQMDNIALPMPDPAMAPIRNPYSAAALDPRLDDSNYGVRAASPEASKSAETVTGLAPPTINDAGVSPGSSVGPTPPPKDTPKVGGFGGGEYFPPPVPLKPKTAEQVAAHEGLAPPSRPSMLPTLSTNTAPNDDENDKLRKEIVKSLSPRVSLSYPSGTLDDHNLGQSMLGVSSTGQPRESMYLPSEYGDYWNSAEDDSHNQSQIDATLATAPAVPSNYNVNVTAASPVREEAATPPIPPLNPKRMSRTSQDMSRTSIDSHPSCPGFLETRYSWEQGQEKAKQGERTGFSTAAAIPIPDSRAISPEVELNGKAAGRLPTNTLSRVDSASPAPLSIRSAKVSEASLAPEKQEEPQGLFGKAAAVGAAAVASVATTAAALTDEKQVVPAEIDMPQLESVVVDEDACINDKALSSELSPLSSSGSAGRVDQIPSILSAAPMPNASVHHYTPLNAPIPGQERDSLQDMKPSPLNVSRPVMVQSASASHHSHGSRPLNSAAQPSPKAFREIMSLQTPEQRILAFSEARSQYATMESGLSHWLAVQTGLGSALPSAPQFSGVPGGEHSGQRSVSTNGGAGGGGGAHQMPYYQQYINASSNSTPLAGTPSRQSTHGPGGGYGLSGTQGFGSGSKSQQAREQAERATEQAKAKSKEFLHSAGVFGGKGVKAGKGLLMKGKSRWLGGGDKKHQRSASSPLALQPQIQDRQSYDASRPPIEASKDRRRTSWIPHLGRPASRGMTEVEGSHSLSQSAPHPSTFGQEEHKYLQGSWRNRGALGGSGLQNELVQVNDGNQHELPGQKTPREMGLGLAIPPLVPQGGRKQQQQEQKRQQQQQNYARKLAGQQATQEIQQLGIQKKDSASLPLPPGIAVHESEVDSSTTTSTPQPAQPPILELNLPKSSLRDVRWMGSPSASTASVATRTSLLTDAKGESPLPKLPTEKDVPELPLPDLPWDTKRLESDESRDTLGMMGDGRMTGAGPPKPIGKFQPSWDPFNATPIAEEDGFGWGSGGSGDSAKRVSPSGSRRVAPTTRPLSEALGGGSSEETTKSLTGQSRGEEDKSVFTEKDEDWVVVSPDEIDSPESADSGAQNFLKAFAQGKPLAKHDRGLSEVSEVSALTLQPEPEAASITTFQEGRGVTNLRNDDIAVTAEEVVLMPAEGERGQISPLGQVMANKPHSSQLPFQYSSLGESIDLAHQPVTISRSGTDDSIQQTPDAIQFISQSPLEQSLPEDTKALTPPPPQVPSHDSSPGGDLPLPTAELSRGMPGFFPDVSTPGTVGTAGTVEKEKEIEDFCESYFAASPELSPQNQSLTSSMILPPLSLAPAEFSKLNQLVGTESGARGEGGLGDRKEDGRAREEERQDSWEAGDNQEEPSGRSIVAVEPRRENTLQGDRSLSVSPPESIHHYTVGHDGELIRTPAAEQFTTLELAEHERRLIPVGLARPVLEQERGSLAPTKLREICASPIEKANGFPAPAETEDPMLDRGVRSFVHKEMGGLAISQDDQRRIPLVPSELANLTMAAEESRRLTPEEMRAKSRVMIQTEDVSRPLETAILAKHIDEEAMAEPKQRQTSLRLVSQSPQTSSLVPIELRKGVLEEQPRSIMPDQLQQNVHTEQEQAHSTALAELQPPDMPTCLFLANLGQQQQHPANIATQDVTQIHPLSPTELSIPSSAEEYTSLVPEEMKTPESQQEAYDEPMRTQTALNQSYPQQRDQITVSETAVEEPGPRRTSSFSLSHIRQGSLGFGRTVSKIKRAKERFSIEDDEESVDSSQVVSPMLTTEPPESIKDVTSRPSQETITSPCIKTVAASNRLSFQPSVGGHMGGGEQTEVLTRPPMMQQGSSDYNTVRTGTSTPTLMGAYLSQNQYLADTPYMTPTDGPSPNSILMDQQRQQVHQPIMPAQVPAQGRREFSFEMPRQPQHKPPPSVSRDSFEQEHTTSQQMSGAFGTPSSDHPPSQLTRRNSEALPARYAVGASTNFPQPRRPSLERNSLERNTIVQRPPSVTTAPQIASPLQVAAHFTEAISPRPQYFIRTGAREGPPGIPPSSAQRYPELFQSTQPVDYQHERTPSPSRADSSQLAQEVKDDGEHLPGEYPTVEKGCLPRQQATEYALPGVGPPADEPMEKERNGRHSRRGSGIFKEISGRLSRAASRERTSRQVSRERRSLSKQPPVVIGIDAGDSVERRDPDMTVGSKKDEKDREHNSTKSLLAMVNPFGGRGATSENERPNSKAENMATHDNQPFMTQQPGSQFPPQGPQQAASQQQPLPPPQPGYQQFQVGPRYEAQPRPIQPVHQQTAQYLAQAPPPGLQQSQQHQLFNSTTRNVLQKRSSTASKHASMAFPAAAPPSSQTQRPLSTAFPASSSLSAGASASPSPQKNDRKSFFGGLFGKKRSSGVVEVNDRDNGKLAKKPPVAAVLGAAAVGAQHAPQQQMMFQQHPYQGQGQAHGQTYPAQMGSQQHQHQYMHQAPLQGRPLGSTVGTPQPLPYQQLANAQAALAQQHRLKREISTQGVPPTSPGYFAQQGAPHPLEHMHMQQGQRPQMMGELQNQPQGAMQMQQHRESSFNSPPLSGPYQQVRAEGQTQGTGYGLPISPQQGRPMQQQQQHFRAPPREAFPNQMAYEEYMRRQRMSFEQGPGQPPLQSPQAREPIREYYAPTQSSPHPQSFPPQAPFQSQGQRYSGRPPPAAFAIDSPPVGASKYYQSQSKPQQKRQPSPFDSQRQSGEYIRELNRRESGEYGRSRNHSQSLTQPPLVPAQPRGREQRKEQEAVHPHLHLVNPDPSISTLALTPEQRTAQQIQQQQPIMPGAFSQFPLNQSSSASSSPPDRKERKAAPGPFLGQHTDIPRRLSQEDLVARSPARAQFGQQAPYQLSLPRGDDEDEEDERRARDRRRSPLHQQQFPAAVPLSGRGIGSGEGKLDNRAEEPLSLAKWSSPPNPAGKLRHRQGAGASQTLVSTTPGTCVGVNRSNTIHSEVSALTADSNGRRESHPVSRSPPTNPASPNQSHEHTPHPGAVGSVSSRSSAHQTPHQTPVVKQAETLRPAVVQNHKSEPLVQRIHINRTPDSRTPEPSPPVATPASGPVRSHLPLNTDPPRQPLAEFQIERTGSATEPKNGLLVPDHEGLIYDNSREGLIVVEDATVRRLRTGERRDEEEVVMSATSFPGDEWRPWGYESYNEGGYDGREGC